MLDLILTALHKTIQRKKIKVVYFKLVFCNGDGGVDNRIEKEESKETDGVNKPLEVYTSFSQKILTRGISLLAPAANMLGTSRFPTGCMKWQHGVILESICEFPSIISLPV